MMYVTQTSTMDTGGGCMNDTLTLRDGGALILADECIAFYRNVDAHLAGKEPDAEIILGGLQDVLQRTPDGSPLTFAASMETWEPDGPVSVDLVTLADGRVVGIDGESAVLYPSRAAFEAYENEEGAAVAYLPLT